MFVRRRPIARAAVVGGIAHQAGKAGAASANREAEEQAAAAAPPPPAEAPAGGMSEAVIQQLKELASLHESGVLTDEEFEAEKARILD